MDTLIDLLRTASQAHAEKTALSTRAGLREDVWSYGRLWRSTHALARYFRDDMELAPGSRLVVWGPNCPQLVATYFGAMLARLILVPVDPYSTATFLGRVIEKTQAAAAVTGFPQSDIQLDRSISLWELPFDARGPAFPTFPSSDEVAEIVFTSGTTGAPKGVILTHNNIVANIESARSLLPEDPGYRLLSILPLSHMLEQTVGLYLPLLFGSAVYYPTSRQSPVILKMMRRYGITTMVAVPQALELMLGGIEREIRRKGKTRQWRRAHRLAERLPMELRRFVFREVHRQLGGHLDFIICGGARLEPELAATWERMGVKVIQGYGTTECAPIVATNTYWTRTPGSVGRPAPGVEVRLSDEGEILARGPNVTPGYWEDEIATRAAFTADGWYRTGDVAVQDKEGHLYLQGRLKDVIVLPNGLKVYPEDVERELLGESAIADCIVLSLPDAAGDAQVHAVVIPADAEADQETQRARLNQVVRNANARLAPHQRIMGFTLWAFGEFPHTNLLKVKRHEVLAALTRETPPAPTHPAAAPLGDERFLQLRRLLSDVSGVSAEDITPESDLTLDLKLDSLNRVELAVLLEERLGALVEDGDLAAVASVAQLGGLLGRSEVAVPPLAFPAWSLRSPARAVRAALQQLLVFPLHRLVCRPFVVEGREHLQGITPPLLLIANHTSHVDTPSILRALPWRVRHRVAVAAAADYFYRTRALGAAMSLLLNTFPFSRVGAVRSSLEYCGELVDGGWSILFYPEGTRSPSGAIQPFQSGIGLLASELNVPIVPIAVSGSYAILPKGRRWPRRGAVTVRIGVPISLYGGSDRIAAFGQLEEAVATLLGR